jgi:hypothetical protein
MTYTGGTTGVNPGVAGNVPGGMPSSSGFSFFPGGVPTTGPTATGPGTAAGTNTPIFPGASTTPYYLQQIGADSVNLGSALGGGTTNISTALTRFLELPSAQLSQLEELLLAGGFYAHPNTGVPFQRGDVVIGAQDDQAKTALLTALSRAYDTGQSLTSVINDAIQSGGGTAGAQLPGAVTGGANTYTIDLANPEDVRYAADQIFQATLGRNATAAEVDAATTALRSQQTAQGLAKQQGAEMTAQQRYQTSVNQRNIAFQFANVPKIAGGAVPNGPVNNPSEWAVSFLQYLGGVSGGTIPVNQSNIAFILGWISAEGSGLGGMNPLGSTITPPGAPATLSGTPSYQSWAQSFQATAQALTSPGFTNILGALMNGNADTAAASRDVRSELSKWSNGKYGDISAHVNAAQHVAAGASQVAQQQAAGNAMAVPAQPLAVTGTAQSMGAEGGGPMAGAAAPTAATGTAQSMGAEGGGPQAAPTVPANAVNPGQVVTNPGDAYINPVTVYSTDPAAQAAQLYQEATTGANRPEYLGNQYAQFYQNVIKLIQGAVTGNTVG